MTAETDIAAIADSGDNTPGDVRTALTSVLGRADVFADASTDWTTWTPSYTNLTIGNGTVVARYTNINGTVTAYFLFTLGSTSAVGSGPTVSLPVNRSASYGTNTMLWGPAYLKAAGTQYVGVVRSPSASTAGLLTHTVSGSDTVIGAISATAPGTWTTSDVIGFQITYEAA